MNNEHDVQNHQPESTNPESEQQETLLAQAFASLRLVSNMDNNLSLAQATAKAYREAETFRRWKEQKTPISGIIVRLSDGQEIEVKKTIVANLCGFHFTSKFAPGVIMHVYKKADADFGEVKLLSVDVDAINSSGYTHEREYNGQTIQLKVQPYANGQLHISVDYTSVQRERVMAASGSSGLLHRFFPVGGAI